MPNWLDRLIGGAGDPPERKAAQQLVTISHLRGADWTGSIARTRRRADTLNRNQG
jgi:hypothetical protein